MSVAVVEAVYRTRPDRRAAAFCVNFVVSPCRSTARRLVRLSGIVSRGFTMKKDRSQGAILMVIGVAALNITSLWDMFADKHEGMIDIGPLAWVAIVIANIAIIASLMTMAGRE